MRRCLKVIALAGCAALAVAAAAAWRGFGPSTYLRFDTKFGRARVYQVEDDSGEPVRLLEVGGIVQSGTYLDERYTELVFEYLKRYDEVFAGARNIERMCVLGCGGYDYPEHVIANHPHTTVDAVEIDPAITAIARRHFYLDRLIAEYETERTGRLNLVCSDALDFLNSTSITYDAIVNDTFDAGTPPAHLATRTFYEQVYGHLNPGGSFATNIVSALVGPRSAFLHAQIELMRSVFDDVRALPCATDTLTEPDNVIVIATKAEHTPETRV